MIIDYLDLSNMAAARSQECGFPWRPEPDRAILL